VKNGECCRFRRQRSPFSVPHRRSYFKTKRIVTAALPGKATRAMALAPQNRGQTTVFSISRASDQNEKGRVSPAFLLRVRKIIR